MLEPTENQNSKWMVNPPSWLRVLLRYQFGKLISPDLKEKRRAKAEKLRVKQGRDHVVEYFHQLDDPYSDLTAQILARLATKYAIEIKPYLIEATGGKDQPELEKLQEWARRDVELIAPHYGLSFIDHAPVTPDRALQSIAGQALVGLTDAEFVNEVGAINSAMWSGDASSLEEYARDATPPQTLEAKLTQGAARLKELKHYSGATFFYGGEWYWGVDRLFHLEQRLRELGLQKDEQQKFIVTRPEIDVTGCDAMNMKLDFYPSLNSPYTAVIYDKTIELKDACGIQFGHKPVLPMIMRGVPATRAKGNYIFFDTKREAEHLGVSFGPVNTPIGDPVRRAYSLLPWAMKKSKDEALMSAFIRCAFVDDVPLHTLKGLRIGVERAGLDWDEAQSVLDTDDWKSMIEQFQLDMVEGLGLWGVPSYRLSGPDGEPDLAVWGQDRLWLVAAEIRRRSKL